MYVTAVILSCSLLAQAAAGAPPAAVQSAERRTSAADLVAEALTLPDGGTLAGRPMTLLEALSSVRGSRQQLEVTHAYWRLTRAVAEYRFCFEECGQLGQIEARPEDAMMLRAARASAAAGLAVAELAVLSAQHDLAQRTVLPATASLPLPADLPHVGTYLTYFQEVFSMRNPPVRARLIDRGLPIRRQVIEARASAVRASQDALETGVEAYLLGRAGLAEVLASLRHLGGQRRALLTSVSDYNHDIADYAFSVAGPQTDEHLLVAMLIRPGRRPSHTSLPPVPREEPTETSQPTDGEQLSVSPSGVRPATLDVPAPSRGVDEPAPGPPDQRLRSLGRQRPTLAPPQKLAEPGTDPEEAEPAEPEEAESAEPQVSETLMVPVPAEASKSASRTANKPSLDEEGVARSALGLYSPLLDAKPAVQAKLLTEELHRRRTLPEQVGESIGLEQCLAALSGPDRRQVIAAYWLTAQKAAAYQALVGQVDFFEELVPMAMEHRSGPLGAEAMLDLRAALLAAQADLLAAHLGLLEAQFQLARSIGRPLDTSWPLPRTTPHSGPYLLKLDAQPRELVESWPVRRLAAVIPALSKGIQQRAAAVVEADAARAEATAAYRAGLQPIAPVLASITHQTEETLTFLQTLTKYNEAIADYALRVLPLTVPGEQLAGALVVVQ